MRFLKANYRYFFIIVGFLVFGFYVMAFIWPEYRDWKFWRDIRREAAKFEKIREDREKAIAADAYGGKTPQETLDMFIAAVEKGDYELASKYFVVERQEEELQRIKNIKDKNNLETFVNLLKKAKPVKKDNQENSFRMESKITSQPSLFINFVKYPSGIWKIDEI
ncbi:MAG: hypothetical protein L6Q29_01475 [Candidatus Pacebacteria bacterium]|nr:hypothetical protein [Candidatus Paceibacterota bacterium]